MRSVVCTELSGPDGLEVVEQPQARCPEDKVRIAVRASGLNYVDALFTQGRYQIKPPLPFTPGSEIAGEITEIGDRTVGWNVGDRVCASVGLGGFTSEVVLDPLQLVRVPDRLSFGQAATMIQSYATAWFTLNRRTTLRPDEWVLVLGAAGGVGLAIIDVAKSAGAKVIAAASSDAKLELCSKRGADATINYSTTEVKTSVRELTGGGADMSVDPVGGPLAEQALRSLGTYGRQMIIGFASGEIPSLPANQVLLRNRQVIGVDWGAWAMTNPSENASMISEIMAAAASGKLNPIEPSTYALDDVAQGLADLLNRRVTGKAALIP